MIRYKNSYFSANEQAMCQKILDSIDFLDEYCKVVFTILRQLGFITKKRQSNKVYFEGDFVILQIRKIQVHIL